MNSLLYGMLFKPRKTELKLSYQKLYYGTVCKKTPSLKHILYLLYKSIGYIDLEIYFLFWLYKPKYY